VAITVGGIESHHVDRRSAATSNLAPDGVIMHPSNYLQILLSKGTTGDYYGDGPFAAPGAASLWGLPVALTVAIPLNTALVGAFKIAAQVFRHGGIRVDASNSHQDYFVKNLVAIRAEERLALAVYRAAAIGAVTGLT
jgi:HK97 family phage major capsid protein